MPLLVRSDSVNAFFLSCSHLAQMAVVALSALCLLISGFLPEQKTTKQR